MTERDQWDRLFDAFDDRLDRVGGDPIEECERIYAEAYETRNVRIAATAAVFIAELLQRAEEPGLDLGTEDLLNRSLAWQVEQRLLKQRSVVTVDEAAALMRCTPQHVRRLARQGQVSGRRHPDGSWRCSAASILSYKRRKP